MDNNKNMRKLFQAVYEEGGASAVYDVAKTYKWKDWGHCKACEAETPVLIENEVKECLICGSRID